MAKRKLILKGTFAKGASLPGAGKMAERQARAYRELMGRDPSPASSGFAEQVTRGKR